MTSGRARALLGSGAIIAVVAGTALLAACAGEDGGGRDAAGPRPPILLISLDTVRRDALGARDAEGASLTPALDALAADAVTFTGARAQMPFTLASHMSMFTGLYPDVHRVTAEDRRLPERIVTLPEVLADLGYENHGVVTNLWMKPVFGFGRAFDSYELLEYGLTYADRVTERALDLLDEVAGRDGRPFLFLHYLDAHSDWPTPRNRSPYYAPSRYLEGLTSIDTAVFCDEQSRCATEFMMAADEEGRAVPDEVIAAMRAFYGRGIRALDDELGRLFDGLKASGRYDESLIIVVSDHGEEFREHGAFGHTQTYDESLAVPFLVKLPGNARAGATVDAPVQTIDLLPTVLDLLGARPRTPVQGRSLAHWLAGPDHAPGDESHAESGAESGGGAPPIDALGQERDRPGRYALVRDGLKLVHDTESGHAELYDLTADPAERFDLRERRPEAVAELLAVLEALLEENAALAALLAPEGEGRVDDALTEEEIERLRALGYLR